MNRIRYFIVALVISMGTLIGCATHSRTVRTETVQQVPEDRYAVERETRTETTRTDSDGGVVSGTVDTIGEVLALPFRIVGGAIRFLF